MGVTGDPVIIVGGGPVGITLALLLARWEVPTLVLEAADTWDSHSSASKAICQQRDVLDIWDRVDIAESLIREGVTWRVGRTFYRGVELFSTTFAGPGASSLPPWINISQTRTERLLLDRAHAEPLVDLRYGHHVVGLDDRGHQIEAAVDTPTGPRRFGAGYLVGADGAHSAVRRLAGIGFPGESFDEQFLILDIRADLPFPNERHFHFDPPWNPGRQVLIHECPDGVWRIDWQVPADFDLQAEQSSGALDQRIRRIVGDGPYEIVWLSVYRFHERVADSFRLGRLFLVGDAAHLIAPFGARGLNSGVQDAENLSWKLALAWRGVTSPAMSEALLESFEVERRAAALENLAITTATMNFLVPHSEEQWARRRAVLERAASDPSARAEVDSGKLAQPFAYRTSPITTPLSTRFELASSTDSEETPIEPVGPLPGCLSPDGPCRVLGRPRVSRLRQLFGNTFVVLVARPADLPQVDDGITTTRAALPGLPVVRYLFSDLDASGTLGSIFDLQDSEVYVVRPDGHIAARLEVPRARDVADALQRACGESGTPCQRSAIAGSRDSH